MGPSYNGNYRWLLPSRSGFDSLRAYVAEKEVQLLCSREITGKTSGFDPRPGSYVGVLKENLEDIGK